MTNIDEVMKQNKTFDLGDILLRHFTNDDLHDVFEYASDNDTVKYLTFPAHENLAESQKVLESFYIPNAGAYAVVLKSKDKCIGCFDLRIDKENNKATFGYVLNKHYWGNGHMTKVLGFMISFCFDKLDLNRFESTYYIGNEGSGKVMQKCGMKIEGIAKKELIIKGTTMDVAHLSILKEEYYENCRKSSKAPIMFNDRNNMSIRVYENNGQKIAVLESPYLILTDAQSALELLAEIKYSYSCDRIALYKATISDDFFDLRSKLAGEILQKFINYHIKLAIIGDFSLSTSRNLNDFIYESNKGNDIFFLPTLEGALERLGSVK